MNPEVNRRGFGILLGALAARHLLPPKEARAQQEPPIDEEKREVLGATAEGGQPPEIAPAPFPVDQTLLRRYLAEGPYVDPVRFQTRVFQHTNSGATVVLSERMQLEDETFARVPGEPLPILTQQDGVLLTPDGTYLFSFDEDTKRDTVTLLTADGEVSVGYPPTNPYYYKPQVLWHEGLGIVGTDKFIATHTFDPQTLTWSELENYVPLGTPEQRIRENLQDFLTATYEVDGHTSTNILDLDPAEVAQYRQTGSDKGLQSFQVFNDAEGRPAFPLITSKSKYGIQSKELIGAIRAAVDGINKANPQTVRRLGEFGVRAVTKEVAPGTTFETYPTYATTFRTQMGVIQLNERLIGPHVTNLIAYLVMESYGIDYDRTSKNRITDKDGFDKALRLARWANESNLTKDERETLRMASEFTIKVYSRSL